MDSTRDSRSGAGLYLHVPYCSRICPYCDFAVTRGGAAERSMYARGLESEIDLWSGEPFRFDTVYFGGGTPSTLAEDDLARVLETIGSRLSVDDGAGVFLEANPEDASPERCRAWRSLGVGTLSLGVQSFAKEELKRLGRRHDREGARRAVERAREAGFETVSIDLIYGLPGQTAGEWRRNLEELVRLAPDHASCYQLTFHEGTPYGTGLRKGVLRELPDDDQAALFELTHRFLGDSGYEGYEVSSFARAPRHRSRHNRKYWDHSPYLGLGASAHSFRDRERWWNERSVEDYSRRLAHGERPVAGRETLSDSELALEAVMLGLRTREGIELDSLRSRYGVDLLALNRERIERCVQERLARLEAGRLFLTIRGLAVTDAIAREIRIE